MAVNAVNAFENTLPHEPDIPSDSLMGKVSIRRAKPNENIKTSANHILSEKVDHITNPADEVGLLTDIKMVNPNESTISKVNGVMVHANVDNGKASRPGSEHLPHVRCNPIAKVAKSMNAKVLADATLILASDGLGKAHSAGLPVPL